MHAQFSPFKRLSVHQWGLWLLKEVNEREQTDDLLLIPHSPELLMDEIEDGPEAAYSVSAAYDYSHQKKTPLSGKIHEMQSKMYSVIKKLKVQFSLRALCYNSEQISFRLMWMFICETWKTQTCIHPCVQHLHRLKGQLPDHRLFLYLLSLYVTTRNFTCAAQTVKKYISEDEWHTM